jgi:uncharacterized protein YkwD
LCFGPGQLLAQRSQEAHVDFGAPVVAQSATGEPNLVVARQLMIEQTNAFRRAQGQQPVRLNADLENAASSFAHYMATNDKYGHTADGHEPWERARSAGYDYCLIDENIAYASDPAGFTTQRLVEIFVRGWEQSPEHRRNLLDPDIIDIGVAVAHDTKTGKYYAVQDFGRPKSMALHFTISNHTDSEFSYRIDTKDFKLPPHYRMTHSRCRQTTVEVTLSGRDGKEHVETIRPSNDQTFTIHENESGQPIISGE